MNLKKSNKTRLELKTSYLIKQLLSKLENILYWIGGVVFVVEDDLGERVHKKTLFTHEKMFVSR
jgi:hypothetical protein